MHYLRKSALSSSVPSNPPGYRGAKLIYCSTQSNSCAPKSEIYCIPQGSNSKEVQIFGHYSKWILLTFHKNELNQIIGLATS
jgi:hypothetical protein